MIHWHYTNGDFTWQAALILVLLGFIASTLLGMAVGSLLRRRRRQDAWYYIQRRS